MKKPLSFSALILLAHMAAGQSVPSETIRSTSTLVVVPTLVQTDSGELVTGLHATDFVLTDNGVEQAVSIEEAERQPVAVVVLVQTGGSAPRQFENYSGLTTMLDSLTGSSPRRVAMVTFDSQPEEASDFTSDVGDLKEDLTHPAKGDGGAAIFDAVDYGINLLREEPTGTRRILVLLSQKQDDGSKIHADEIVRRLGETNTIIFSVTFSPEKTWLKDQFTKERHENPLYEFSPGIMLDHTFNLSKPLGEALRGMQEDAAATIATLSGGESMPFDGKGDLDRQLSILANHLPSRYTLTFRPTSSEPGFHAIKVQVAHQQIPLMVHARESYWSTGPSQ